MRKHELVNLVRFAVIVTSLFSLGGLVACAPQSPSAAVTAVSIDQSDSAVVVGESLALSATVTAVGGAAEAVTWSSSNVAFATVSTAGVVEAVAVGVATITATSSFDVTRSDSIDVTVLPPTGTGTESWTHQFGTNNQDLATGVAVDSDDNVYIVGHTRGVLDGSSAGGLDAFVRKVDSSGSVMWTRQFGTSEWDYATGVAVDSDGNVLIVGHTEGNLDGANSGLADAYVRKVDGNGTPMWTHQFGTNNQDLATGVAVDSAGNVLIVGHTGGDLDGSNEGSSDAFVRKVDSNGVPLWTRQFGTSASDYATGVAVDSAGNVLIVGHTGGDLAGPNAGGADAFVRKIDGNGSLEWSHIFGTSAWDSAAGVAVDSAGNVLIVGYTEGVLDGSSAGGPDAFVRKVDGNGAPLWTRHIGTSASDFAVGVAVDSTDNVLIAGYTAGDLDGHNAGTMDTFVRMVDADGAPVWTHQFGTSALDHATGIAVDSDDNVLIVGDTEGGLDGPNAGGRDAFVMKHLP